MSSPSIRFDARELLAQLGWVRQLARRVAADADVAEDLTQEAMLVALREGTAGAPDGAPRTGESTNARTSSLRRWLACVVRNLGRTQRRARERRRERETATIASRSTESPSTVELIERASVQRALVDALLELDEPYRSTLLLRYFEGCTPRQVAERTGVPPSTVSTRTAEGLKRLRCRFRDRRHWLSGILAALLWPRTAAASTLATGAIAVKTSTKLILAGALVVTGALVYRATWSPVPGSTPASPDESHPAAAAALEPGDGEEPTAEIERTGVASTPEIDPPKAGFHDIAAHAGIQKVNVRGRVIDFSGLAVADVEICCLRPSTFVIGASSSTPPRLVHRTRADARGQFEVESFLPCTLTVRDPSYATVVECEVIQNSEAEHTIVVAPRVPLAGVVVDEAETPISAARLTLVTAVRKHLQPESARPVMPEVSTDREGRFTFESAASAGEAQLQVRANGFVTATFPVPELGDGSLRLVLARTAHPHTTIAGHVRHLDGTPAADALVSTGVLASRTDERGYFVIDFAPWLEYRVDEEAPTVVTAILPGWRPAVATLPSVRSARENGWPPDLVLTLAGEPRTIQGVVVDPGGDPVSGVTVEVLDRTKFGLVPGPGSQAYGGQMKTQEELVGGSDDMTVTTGNDGRFELSGLLDRAYTVRAVRTPSLLTTVTEPVEAGAQDVTIVLDPRDLGTLEGEIVDQYGVGIEGVYVAVAFGRGLGLTVGRSTTTDARGHFRLDDVTLRPEFLNLDGGAIIPELFRTLSDDDDPARLRLEVGRRCRIQFDGGNGEGSEDELVVLDARGEALTLVRMRGLSMRRMTSVPFPEGVSEEFLVSDTARELVVRRNGVDQNRIPLNLRPGELQVIRL